MATTVTLHANKSAEIDLSNSGFNDHKSTTALGSSDKRLLVSFEQLSSQYKFLGIQNFKIAVYLQTWTSSNNYSGTCSIERLLETFDENTVTSSAEPDCMPCLTVRNISKNNLPMYYIEEDAFLPGYEIGDIVKHGCRLTSSTATVQTSRGSNAPYIEITFANETVGLYILNESPAAGAYIPKREDNLFTWLTRTDPSWECVEDVKQQSAIFRWKDEAGTIHELSAGSANSISVSANTFTGSTIQWQIEITANSGVVTTSNWITLSTVEPTSTAVPKRPKNTIVDGANTATFEWEHVISTGSAQTAFDLQISQNKETWSTLKSGTGPNTSTTVSAGELPGGTIYWRVRTYNSDGTAGAWSEAVQIIVLAAPDAPSITVTNTEPRFAIRWQQSGQQAYEIMLDGTLIAKGFGSESHYRYDGYLSPGSYEIKVRVQNKFCLWSDWGTAALPIVNTEVAAITLTASANNSVALEWASSESYDTYIIYRNGKKVGETAELAFTDHFALGEVKYEVRGTYADSGNYALSNAVVVNIKVDTILIADVDDPVWLRLDKSKTSLRAASIGDIRNATYTHHVGAQLPSVEIGEAVSKSYRLDCAWRIDDMANIRAFEQLPGKVVCIKTYTGRRIIGVMGELSISEDCMTISYQTTITMIDWEDELQQVVSSSDNGGGATPGGEATPGLVVDKTLTMEGAAAEAKATGTRLKALELALEEFLDEAAALLGGV